MGRKLGFPVIGLLVLMQVLSAYTAADVRSSSSFIRVPQDADLQTAIWMVEDGGIIEISGGTYYSPSGGFVIHDLGKSFTIRAAPGETVILDGRGSNEIITFINSDISCGGVVTFQDLIFANGKAVTDGRAGAVTMQRAEARFERCTFRYNVGEQPSTGGGAVLVAIGSKAVFEGCIWEGNTAKNFGGGLAVNDHAEAVIYDSQFINNSANPSGHSPSAAGGALHVGNSSAWVYRSSFDSNQAGYVGGAVYLKGEWGNHSFILIADSVFTGNAATPAYSLSLPTEGGAFHVEDDAEALILRSRFVGNQAMIGGAVNVYRASVEIRESFFEGNSAYGTGAANGLGGSLSISSNDTPSDGNVNRPSASVTVRDSVFLGPPYSSAQSGGAIYVAGDGNRTYGINGVARIGTPEENRAVVQMERVFIADNSVEEQTGVPGTGVGAALMTDLASISVKDSVFTSNSAVGSENSSGGALALINNSASYFENIAVAYNSSDKFGGGLFVQGSSIQMQDSLLFDNVVGNGTYGSAIFAAPDEGRNLDARGSFLRCTLSGNAGLPIYDDDRDIVNGPINDVRYNANQFYLSSGQKAYRDALVGSLTVDELNELTVVRPNSGRNTKKSQIPNTQLLTRPPLGMLVAISPYFVPSPNLQQKHYLGFVWDGDSAELNGASLSETSGIVEISQAGVYTLTVHSLEATEVITAEFKELSNQVYVPLVLNNR